MPTNVPITVWCVYVNSDKLWEEEFRKHLSAYTRQGLFTLQSIEYPAAVDGSGARPTRGIRPNDLVLVLISPDLLGCGECMDHIESLLARRRGNPSPLIPVLVRPVPWKASRLGVLQPLPASGTFLSASRDTDEALYEVAEAIRARAVTPNGTRPEATFFYGGMILDERQFIGRDHLVQQLLEQLPRRVNHLMLGERRIGKSSLLFHLARSLNGATDDRGVRIQALYIDLQGMQPAKPSGWFKLVLRAAREAAQVSELPLPAGDECSVDKFQDLCWSWGDAQSRLVLLLDEGELMFDPQHEFTVEDFINPLRSLVNSGHLTLCIACRAIPEQDGHWFQLLSPLLPVLRTTYLGLWEDGEAATLLDRAGAALAPAERTWLLRQAGTYPGLLQLSGLIVTSQRASQPESSDPAAREARLSRWLEALQLETQRLLSELWNRRSAAEQNTLVSVARGKAVTATATLPLRSRGLLVNDAAGRTRIFGELFEQFILAEAARADASF